MVDRWVPVLEELENLFFVPLKISQKINFLIGTKHPKNTFVALFWKFDIFSQTFPKLVPIEIKQNEGYE